MYGVYAPNTSMKLGKQGRVHHRTVSNLLMSSGKGSLLDGYGNMDA